MSIGGGLGGTAGDNAGPSQFWQSGGGVSQGGRAGGGYGTQ